MTTLTPGPVGSGEQLPPTTMHIPRVQQRPCSVGLPPSVMLVRSAVGKPTVSISRQHSATPESSPHHSRSASYVASSPTLSLPLPAVPAGSWYANALADPLVAPMSTFHRGHRGKVVFSPRAVPVEADELAKLPGQGPMTLTVCEVGKDLLYGMAYLYAPPLAIEHRWRGRVAHLHRVQQMQAPIPEAVRRRLEGRASLLGKQQGSVPRELSSSPSSAAKVSRSPSPCPVAPGITSAEYGNIMRFARGEASVYDHPADNLRIGFKVYVNDELVEDHYPDVHALPQCTATITAKEAAHLWSCVPLVLIGYLNQTLLNPISMFHTLSLSFVEHLLRVKLPGRDPAVCVGERVKESPTLTSSCSTTNSSPAKAWYLELPLRVEVVYGCRTEAYYCTDFISRGQCVLSMTESSKPSLKSYEEKLRALVKLNRAAPQLIHRSTNPRSLPRACTGCGHLLQYHCTVCGAEVCGELICTHNATVGYPRPCREHVLESRKS